MDQPDGPVKLNYARVTRRRSAFSPGDMAFQLVLLASAVAFSPIFVNGWRIDYYTQRNYTLAYCCSLIVLAIFRSFRRGWAAKCIAVVFFLLGVTALFAPTLRR